MFAHNHFSLVFLMICEYNKIWSLILSYDLEQIPKNGISGPII